MTKYKFYNAYTGEICFEGNRLVGARLDSADLKGADLRGADLRGANLRYADLRDADLWGVNLEGADLRSANLKGTDLENANLNGANLNGADLRYADLRDANLDDVDLWDTTGNNNVVRTLQTGAYVVNFYGDRIQIGCRNHSIEEWRGFDDQEIHKMGGDKAVKFWTKYKDIILGLAELV